MIIIGALAKIKAAAVSKYMPDLESEALLASVAVSMPTRNIIPIRKLKTRDSVGKYVGARQNFTVTYSFLTSPTIADTYFRMILADSAKLSGSFYKGAIKSFSEAPFMPISISSASWSVNGDDPANYVITIEYFNLDQTFADGQPLEASIFSLIDSEWEINLRSDEKLPYESESAELSGDYEVVRTIDGYYGIKYSLFTLGQSVVYYDDQYEHQFRYDSYVNQETASESLSSELVINNKVTMTHTKSGILIPSSNNYVIDTTEVF